MLRRAAAAVGVLALTAAVTAAAEPAHDLLPSQAVGTLLDGHVIEGIYADGRTFTESYQSGGGIEYHEGAAVLTGRWSFVAESFCTFYDWQLSGGCWRLRQVADNCYEFYFVAGTLAEARRATVVAERWTARAAVTGLPNGCRELPIS